MHHSIKNSSKTNVDGRARFTVPWLSPCHPTWICSSILIQEWRHLSYEHAFVGWTSHLRSGRGSKWTPPPKAFSQAPDWDNTWDNAKQVLVVGRIMAWGFISIPTEGHLQCCHLAPQAEPSPQDGNASVITAHLHNTGVKRMGWLANTSDLNPKAVWWDPPTHARSWDKSQLKGWFHIFGKFA